MTRFLAVRKRQRPIAAIQRAGLCLLALAATIWGFAQTGAQAVPLVPMVGAPLLSVVPPINGYIFDLTPIVRGVQTGSIVPRFPLRMGADTPVVGVGRCGSFRTGEICRTREPGAGFGVRDWEVELANETGPRVERFVAGFFAPGLRAAYSLVLPRGTGFWFDFRYLGPTAPFFGVFSGLPFPIAIATSIVDPFPTPSPPLSFFDPDICGTDCAATATLTPHATPNIGVSSGLVAEPGTVALFGTALVALGMMRHRRTTRR